MIRIRRGPPPEALAKVRAEELRRVRDARRRCVPYELGDRYNSDGARQALYEAQAWKCCYCEMSVDPRAYPIEHFRPKGKAKHGPDFPPHKGYWWLTWTWENLMLSCPACNSTKLDNFPLDPKGGVLRPRQAPPGSEQPMLIDPASEDPMAAIQFRRLGDRWMAFPRQRNARGDVTIAHLKLNRPSLIDRYAVHVRMYVEPHSVKVRAQIDKENRRRAFTAWETAKDFLFSPTFSFKALTYDVLDQSFSPQERVRFGLVLPRP